MFPDFNSRSGRLYTRACKVLPGGNTRTSLFWPPHQLYAVSGSGVRVKDVDGVERIDFNNNFTTLIHGHSHPLVVERVREQAARAISVGMATELEIELAELICARVSSVEQIRFCNSGTEAVLAAIKAARAYTSRPKVAKCEGVYHGSSDLMEISVASPPQGWGDSRRPASIPMSRGTTEGVMKDILILPFNDKAASEEILNRHADEIAGVIIDPMPVRAGLIPAAPDYLDMLRDWTRKHGSLLVFDEVLTFRLGYHGAQARISMQPDLTAFGKIIGGGLPVGAVGGRQDVMAVFDPRKGAAVWHGGTFNGNPLTMAAGLASMELLTPAAFEHLARLGELTRRAVRDALDKAGVKGQVTGEGSLFRIHLTDRPILDYRSYYPAPDEVQNLDRLMVYMLNHGFLLSRVAVGALSTVMGEEEVTGFGKTLEAGLKTLRKEARSLAS